MNIKGQRINLDVQQDSFNATFRGGNSRCPVLFADSSTNLTLYIYSIPNEIRSPIEIKGKELQSLDYFPW